MRERQNAILGAGLAGVPATYNLDLGGADERQVYERNGRVGGLARSIVKGEYRLDYGLQIPFTIIDRIEELICDLLGDNFHAQKRQAYIYHHKYDCYTYSLQVRIGENRQLAHLPDINYATANGQSLPQHTISD